MITYCPRLIEVDLPIRRISAHARREKSIRHGHISTLHIWFARRPLAACRAVICAALWPDPADERCSRAFRVAAGQALVAFAEQVRDNITLLNLCSKESADRWMRTNEHTWATADTIAGANLRYALLDFIADFANWDASTVPAYLETARAITQAAHEALGGQPDTRPLVVDPFAGGGAIPLEALRVGADAFASDLNPVPVLLNKVVLEYIPRYGKRLAEEVRRWGQWVKDQAEKELAEFYPKDPDGATPIAYLWARTITCEGPGCGAEVPLIRSLWLSKKSSRSTALRLILSPSAKRVDFEIIERRDRRWVSLADPKSEIKNPNFDGTVRKGSATCPCCGYTTPVAAVRRQLKERHGGAADARLFCVVTTRSSEIGRFYRLPTERDLEAVRKASPELERRKAMHQGPLSLVPNEPLDVRGIRHTWAMIYGMEQWGDYFTPRQALALTKFGDLVRTVFSRNEESHGLRTSTGTCLALAVDRQADRLSALAGWDYGYEKIRNTFGRQAIPMMWDFAEANPFSGATGDWDGAVEWVAEVVEENTDLHVGGIAKCTSATDHPLPDDSTDALITDPPYYDAVPYSYLSDFFYVWLRRILFDVHSGLFGEPQTPKDNEIIVDRPHELSDSHKDIAFYERELTRAFAEGRRIVKPEGIGTIVFASKTTSSWEAILQAVIDADWIVTGSWPIDTEMENRVAAQGQARLGSSVHLVCRPRETSSGALIEEIGDWREVLQELPGRIRSWLPRLAQEGVVGADAIFACLGPALEIFSRYSRVEKASGEEVLLREYLEHVWAAVSREALTTLFAEADASGLEADARLTAMWLWTLRSTTGEPASANGGEDLSEPDEDDEETASTKAVAGGYNLEYDAARKIAQGLGAHLETLGSIVEIKGSIARLRPVAERTRFLFGGAEALSARRRPRPGAKQLDMFTELEQAEEEHGWGELIAPPTGATVLDQVHQAMILFAAQRAEALRRFLADQGVGRDGRFWKLAQALSALYPQGSDEKRWVDGVLSRKKSLGF